MRRGGEFGIVCSEDLGFFGFSFFGEKRVRREILTVGYNVKQFSQEYHDVPGTIHRYGMFYFISFPFCFKVHSSFIFPPVQLY